MIFRFHSFAYGAAQAGYISCALLHAQQRAVLSGLSSCAITAFSFVGEKAISRPQDRRGTHAGFGQANSLIVAGWCPVP